MESFLWEDETQFHTQQMEGPPMLGDSILRTSSSAIITPAPPPTFAITSSSTASSGGNSFFVDNSDFTRPSVAGSFLSEEELVTSSYPLVTKPEPQTQPQQQPSGAAASAYATMIPQMGLPANQVFLPDIVPQSSASSSPSSSSSSPAIYTPDPASPSVPTNPTPSTNNKPASTGSTGSVPSSKPKRGVFPPDMPVWPANLPKPAVLGGVMPAPSRRKKRTKRSDDPEDPANVDDGYDSDSPEVLSIAVPRETLLLITSQQMSRYVKHLRETRKLTPAQEKELKRERRLVKNRESAKNSRQRKVDRISELDEKVAALQAENAKLKAENERLRNGLSSKKRAHPESNLDEFEDTLSSSSSSASSAIESPTQSLEEMVLPGLGSNRSLRLAGVFLLIFLFSFGLLFQVSRSPNSLFGSGLQHENIPSVYPKVLRSAVPFPYIPLSEQDSVRNRTCLRENNLATGMCPIRIRNEPTPATDITKEAAQLLLEPICTDNEAPNFPSSSFSHQ